MEIPTHKSVPHSQPAKNLNMNALSECITEQSIQARHERQVWKLASILFDPLDVSCADFTQGIPADQLRSLEQRIRRDAVSRFWTQLVHDDAAEHVKNASTNEEKALARLSGNDVEEACAVLVDGRDFRLATIISQLPSDSETKNLMAKQIQSWRSQNVVSEMADDVRTLYELAAGNACVSEGKSGPAEDRASTFGISERFGIDWRRSFGLRLWFGDDDLAKAVQLFANEVKAGKETVRPLPYFFENKVSPFWSDPRPEERVDTLFALLQLYAQRSLASSTRLQITDLLAPAAVSGNPLNARLSWQLCTLLRAHSIISARDFDDSAHDALTLTFAAQLENANLIVLTARSLLSLSSAQARTHYLQDLLNRSAASLSGPASVFTALAEEVKIPVAWLWRAKALHAASTDAFAAQVSHLLRAGDRADAHAVLCREVGPCAVIEQDYDALRELLGEFADEDNGGRASGNVKTVDGWRHGGQVYFDFVHLLDMQGRGDEGEAREAKVAVLKRLSVGLPGMVEGRRTGKVALQERVAVAEMAACVRREVERLGRDDKVCLTSDCCLLDVCGFANVCSVQVLDEKRIARLPVADDAFVKQGVKMSGLYYRALHVQ